jgi:guanine deaminase
VLDLDRITGSFAPGKEADFIVVDCDRLASRPRPDSRPDAISMPELLAQLMFRGDDRLIRATFVRGRCVYRRQEAGRTPGLAGFGSSRAQALRVEEGYSR